MQSRSLGKSDLKIFPILMGTWQAGKEMWAGITDYLDDDPVMWNF